LCLTVVLEESVEVANAVAKLQTSESAIGELRKKRNQNSRTEQAEAVGSSLEREEEMTKDISEEESVQAQEDLHHDDSTEKHELDTQAAK
jgi:hypothetical protein